MPVIVANVAANIGVTDRLHLYLVLHTASFLSRKQQICPIYWRDIENTRKVVLNGMLCAL